MVMVAGLTVWVVCIQAVSNAMLLNAGNTSQYTGLVHATLSEHSVVTGGSFGPCCGGDALPFRPFQVKEALRSIVFQFSSSCWACTCTLYGQR